MATPLNLPSALSSGGLTINSLGSNLYQGPAAPGTNPTIYRLTGQNVPVSSGGSVLGASTVRSSTGGTAAPTSSLDQISQAAKNASADQLNQANSLYDNRSAQLQDQLSALGNQKNSLLDQIGTTYNGLIQGAQDTLTKNIGLLNQNKTDVSNQYDTQRTDVGRSLLDQERINRQVGRAQGTLGSSYYANLQSGAGREATQRVGGLNTEEASKIDAIGSAILNAQTDTNTKLQTLKEEQANAQQDIVNKYQAQADAVNTDLRFNSRDKLNAVQAINNQMNSALDQIGQTFAQYQSAAGNLGGTASNWQNLISNYNPYSNGVDSTLANTSALSAANTPYQSTAAPVQTTTTTPTGYFNTNQASPSILDQILGIPGAGLKLLTGGAL